jgi:hypothetical protein
MFVVGEDGLSCMLGTRLVAGVLGWPLAQPAVDTKGVTRLVAALPRYAQLARLAPVLCIADTDGRCAVNLIRDWRPGHAPDALILRLAVAEAESWLLADAGEFADFLGVAESRLPARPDELIDPKGAILKLARTSKRRIIRQEVVSAASPAKQGAGYNVHLREFVAHRWQPRRAAKQSPSLARAVRRLSALRPES